MDIDVLRVFNLTIGNVYSIKFPPGVLPFPGLRFLFGECSWMVKGVVTRRLVQNENAWDRIITEENVWDCFIVMDTDRSVDLPLGICSIEAIDLK